MNKGIDTLFTLLNNNDLKEFETILSNDTDNRININQKNSNNNYLIQTAVILNKKEIVTMLINKGARIDIVDDDGRCLLYYPIKYKYMQILDLLLYFNRSSLGILLVDIFDKNGNIPLHYAVKYDDIVSTIKLLENRSNINIKNNEGLSCLHIAVSKQNIELINVLIKYNIDINASNQIGESALHIACNLDNYDICKLLLINHADPNIQDIEHEFAPIIYSIVSNNGNINICELLFSYGANINIQDTEGNTPLHVIIGDNNLILFNWIIEKGVDVNIFNIYGKTALHNLIENKMIDYNSYIKLIELSDVNIQDNMGNTALHLLVALRKWEQFSNILVKKPLDIFIKNKNGKTVIDLLIPEEYDIFMDMVCKSFMYQVDDKIIPEKCDKKIKENIITSQISIPPNKYVYNTDIILNYDKKQQMENVNIFIGIPLDVLSGLLFLLGKHSIATSILSTDYMNNPELYDYYISRGSYYNISYDYLNFEIIWTNQRLFLPTTFTKYIENAISDYKSFGNPHVIIIPIGIEHDNYNHANYLIYDLKKKEIERFEPYGSFTPHIFNYNHPLLDKQLKNIFTKFDAQNKYFSPYEYLPKISFQRFEIEENNKYRRIADPEGFCAAWSIWYVDMRLTNISIDRKTLVDITIRKIKLFNYSFKNLIREYSEKISKLRNEMLEIDVNTFINRQCTAEQLELIDNNIKNKITTLASKKRITIKRIMPRKNIIFVR